MGWGLVVWLCDFDTPDFILFNSQCTSWSWSIVFKVCLVRECNHVLSSYVAGESQVLTTSKHSVVPWEREILSSSRWVLIFLSLCDERRVSSYTVLRTFSVESFTLTQYSETNASILQFTVKFNTLRAEGRVNFWEIRPFLYLLSNVTSRKSSLSRTLRHHPLVLSHVWIQWCSSHIFTLLPWIRRWYAKELHHWTCVVDVDRSSLSSSFLECWQRKAGAHIPPGSVSGESDYSEDSVASNGVSILMLEKAWQIRNTCSQHS